MTYSLILKKNNIFCTFTGLNILQLESLKAFMFSIIGTPDYILEEIEVPIRISERSIRDILYDLLEDEIIYQEIVKIHENNNQ